MPRTNHETDPTLTNLFQEKRDGEENTIDDLRPMTPDTENAVTEAKPDVTCTITIAKEHGEKLTPAIQSAFTQLTWVRYVEITGELDVTVTPEELHVTGTYYLTAHLPPEKIAADRDEVLPGIQTRLENTKFIKNVVEISLRMPPYITHRY